MKTALAIALGFALISGCATDSSLRRTDQSRLAQAMAQKRAVAELKCKEAQADWPIRSDRMDDWPDELYSEYKTWAEGCDRRVISLVVCRGDNVCWFADQTRPEPD